jgi:hypothetical protein
MNKYESTTGTFPHSLSASMILSIAGPCWQG